jgi:threonine/homoserine/homoserine lactone efflux protein
MTAPGIPGLLPELPRLAAFLAASLLLAVTPGPGVVYIVARSLLQGRAHGLASVAGVAAGNFANALGAALGLAALFAVSSTAFVLVKWTGAGYLVWLGLRAIRAPQQARAGVAPPPRPLGRIARDGFLVALLNPKTTIFFAAFLPQFMSPDGPHAVQSVLLGAIFVGIAAFTDTIYALSASTASRVLLASRALRFASRWLTGSVLIALGLYTALSGQLTAN